MRTPSLIDKYLPRYTFNEIHEILIDCPIEAAYRAARDFDLSRSKIIPLLFRIRGLPTRRMNLQGFIEDMGFTNLEEKYPFESLTGFWTRMKIEKIPGYEAFMENSISPWIKAVWNFRFEAVDRGRTRVTTETRVLCVAPITKVTFGLYWLLIKPFSGLIRRQMLNIIKEDAESAAAASRRRGAGPENR